MTRQREGRRWAAVRRLIALSLGKPILLIVALCFNAGRMGAELQLPGSAHLGASSGAGHSGELSLSAADHGTLSARCSILPVLTGQSWRGGSAGLRGELGVGEADRGTVSARCSSLFASAGQPSSGGLTGVDYAGNEVLYM